MKNSFYLLLFLFTSCSSLYRFAIEVQEPAAITLPPDALALAVVNNAAPQPGAVGVSRTSKGVDVRAQELNLDSVATVVVCALAKELQKSALFHEIWVAPATIRTDKAWMEHRPLSDSFKTEIFERRNFDVILSIDRVAISLRQEVRNDAYTGIDLSGVTTCTVYIPGRETPLTTLAFPDSLSILAPVEGSKRDIFVVLPSLLVEELAIHTGEQLGQRFVPGWIEKRRILYAGPHSRMAEALSFARNNRWIRAAELWTDLYRQSTQPEMQGKTAANLAVAHEMQDQLDTALEWALLAQTHFRASTARNAAELQNRAEAYIAELRKRTLDSPLLDLQLNP